MRFLLIDDSVPYREEFRALLDEGEFAGAALDHEADAQAGSRAMNSGLHDVCFVDHRLPGDSGIELIRRAREAGVTHPIIFLTGLDCPKLDFAAEQAGANAYLPKGGFSAITLSRIIRYALRHAAHPMPRDTESRFDLAQEAVSIGTWDWDIVRQELLWDGRMYQLFGCEPREDLPPYEVWRRALHPAVLASVEQAMRNSIATGKPYRADFTVIWDDGSEHFIRAAGRVIYDEAGQAVRMIGINWDISDMRQLVTDLAVARDTAQRATEAKSRFLAGISHELRTPLNGILGYAHLLRLEGGLTARQDSRVEAMLASGAHLLDLINRVLDLSAIEAASGALITAAARPQALIEACLDVVRPAALAKSLALGLHIAPQVPAVVRTDPTRLRQVLLNLLGNAVKFTASGAVEVFVTTRGAATWRIEVADTGPGIPPEQAEHLFQEFSRLGNAATHRVEGAGLGLALAERLAALLGGRLGHADNPGGGSRFWLELPHEVAAPEVARAKLAPGPTRPDRCLRILVVDDVSMNRELAEAFLQPAGHAITCVAGGAEAVAAVAEHLFDVVLMDISMPGMDGLEATRLIRAMDTPTARIPIIALTAHAFATQREECRAAGIDHHLTKPFTPTALRDAVLRATETARAAPSATLTGEELPITNIEAFDRTAACLPPAALASYLRTLIERSETLLRQLRASEADQKLPAAAHALAGSAGMFGFERLADAARQFEHAALPERASRAASLIAAASAGVLEMQRRLSALP